MPSGTEILAIDQYLYQNLAGDATLQTLIGNPGRVYQEIPQVNTPYPCLVYQVQAMRDIAAVGTAAIQMSVIDVLVKGIDRGSSYVALENVFERTHTVLTQVQVRYCALTGAIRQRLVRYIEQTDGGERYVHLGGVYRFWVQRL